MISLLERVVGCSCVFVLLGGSSAHEPFPSPRLRAFSFPASAQSFSFPASARSFSFPAAALCSSPRAGHGFGSSLQVARQQPCALRRFGPARVQRCAAASGHGRQELRTSEYQFDDDEPLWLAVVREITGGLRGLVAFLAVQLRQLKHLEWPGFRNTLRTAALTLILVAVFIVALSSVDAALCYIVSWLLRKSA